MTFSITQAYIFPIIATTATLLVLLYMMGRSSLRFYATSFWRDMTLYNLPPFVAHMRYIVLGIAVISIAFAVLQPTWGVDVVQSQVKGADVYVALDVSESMHALDMSVRGKVLDRLTASKLLIADLVAKHPENRYGLLLFAGDAFISSPLTFDTDTFLTFLDAANADDVAVQGTDLSTAVSMALNHFSVASDGNQERGKAVLLISDGGEDAPSDLPVLAAQAKEHGIRIFTLGVGSDKGAPIPESEDVFGRITYKKYNNQIVYSVLNPAPLQALATKTDGAYIHLQSGKDIQNVAKQLNSLDTSLLKKTETTAGKAQYQLFLLLGILSLFLYLGWMPICIFGNRCIPLQVTNVDR